MGAELVLFGSRDGVLSGDSWSERTSPWRASSCKRRFVLAILVLHCQMNTMIEALSVQHGLFSASIW